MCIAALTQGSEIQASGLCLLIFIVSDHTDFTDSDEVCVCMYLWPYKVLHKNLLAALYCYRSCLIWEVCMCLSTEQAI